ncbi:phage tail protein [Paenibacillus tengchongensis]|uniref:phage tail protein n=1 Tax=Paenibacillus tengchongensis TaxID=2608684 RepID=UPI003CCD086B
MNADYSLTFAVPMASLDYRERLPLKGHVKDERGQYYVINKRERQRDGRKLTALISCTHVMFKLADYKFPYASYITEAYGVSISTLTALIQAATGGRFTFSVDAAFDLADVYEFGSGNCLEALNAIIALYGAEVEPDNFTIHLRKKIGNADSTLQYRAGKNIVSASHADDGGSLCTRLYAEMKDSRTWIGQPASILTADEQARLLAADPNAITGGIIRVNYLVSQYASLWASATVPFYDDLLTEQDVTDPLKLLEAARKRLAEREVPALEVSVSAADLHKLDASEAQPGLGDTVTLVDPDLELAHTTERITELTEYPFARDKHAQVTLSNVMRRDYAQIIADLESTRRTVDNVFSGGRIRAEAFEEFARLAVREINDSKTEVKYDTRGIVLQSLVDANDLVVLSSNGIYISTDGGETARTAITAEFINAEVISGQLGSFVSLVIGSGNDVVKINTNGISAGHADFNSAPMRLDMAGNIVLNKLTANSASILTSTFADGDITYGTIRGTEIIGATIRTDTTTRRIILDGTGFRSFDGAGTRRISIDTNDGFGTQEMRYYGADGSKSGVVSGSNGQLNITATPPANLVLAGANVVLGGDAEVEDFPITNRVSVGAGVNAFDLSYVPLVNCTEIEQLDARVAALEAALAGKADAGHTHTPLISERIITE